MVNAKGVPLGSKLLGLASVEKGLFVTNITEFLGLSQTSGCSVHFSIDGLILSSTSLSHRILIDPHDIRPTSQAEAKAGRAQPVNI